MLQARVPVAAQHRSGFVSTAQQQPLLCTSRPLLGTLAEMQLQLSDCLDIKEKNLFMYPVQLSD
jgi:hypothetical protein